MACNVGHYERKNENVTMDEKLCLSCKSFKKDDEYKGFGSCENDEVMERLVFGIVDYFVIAEDFGCRFHEDS